jgi:hypothetical protein
LKFFGLKLTFREEGILVKTKEVRRRGRLSRQELEGRINRNEFVAAAISSKSLILMRYIFSIGLQGWVERDLYPDAATKKRLNGAQFSQA